MNEIPNLKHRADRERVLRENPGILTNIARTTGKTTATVSRIFHGKFDRPNRKVADLINSELARIYGGNNG